MKSEKRKVKNAIWDMGKSSIKYKVQRRKQLEHSHYICLEVGKKLWNQWFDWIKKKKNNETSSKSIKSAVGYA